tara:strand:+ start:630 stop:1580 length:951 start_codon:yes stop_codon:yes gene_type:complete
MIILDLDFYKCNKKIVGKKIKKNFTILRPRNFNKLKKNYDNVFGLICRFDKILDSHYLKKFKNLKFVASITTGTNHIDLNYLKSNKIQLISLTNHRNFLETVMATPEMTFTLIMLALRNLNFNNDKAFLSLYKKKLIGNELFGKTVGIIGYGRVGKILSKYTYNFGAKNIHYDIKKYKSKYSKYSSLNNLLKKSDIVSLNISLNNETINFFNKNLFKIMKSSSILVNTSRGEILNEKDLFYALKNNLISKAALDVLCDEKDGFDLIIKKYKKYINQNKLIITPHISGTTKESLSKTSDFIMLLISKYINNNFVKKI